MESSLSHIRHLKQGYRQALRSKQEYNKLIENDLQTSILRLRPQARLQDTVHRMRADYQMAKQVVLHQYREAMLTYQLQRRYQTHLALLHRLSDQHSLHATHTLRQQADWLNRAQIEADTYTATRSLYYATS